MKNLICILLALSLLAVVGCTQKPAETTTEAAETTAAATEAAEETTAAAEATEAKTIHFRFDEVTLDNNQDPTCKIYNGTVKTGDVTFGSEDESVATFKNGIAVRVADGTTTVFAEYNGERLECVVTCITK